MVLLEAFAGLNEFLSPAKSKIDNLAYVFHYRCSTLLLLACCAFVSLDQFFGAPIECMVDSEAKSYSAKFINTYCWIQSTFSVQSAWSKRIGIEVPYAGIDKSTPEQKQVHHAYYQWVVLVLFIQALFFYIPHFIWKSRESSLINKLVNHLEKTLVFKKKNHFKLIQVAEYLSNNVNHNGLFYCYTLTEVLNLLNVIGQIFFMDKFLNGQFLNFGFDVLMNFCNDHSNGSHPMIQVFPRVAKCTFRMFGDSGDVEKYDTMCILPINIINEKIYFVLWFWFHFIFILSSLNLIYRSNIILFPFLRAFRIQIMFRYGNYYGPRLNYSRIRLVTKHLSIGKWFLLNLILKNIDLNNGYYILAAMEAQQFQNFWKDEQLELVQINHL